MSKRLIHSVTVFILVTVFACIVLQAQVRIAGPGGTSAVGISHGVNLSWTASVTPSVTYKVYRSTVSGGPYTNIASGLGSTSYGDTGLPSGVTYYYVVTTVSGVGESTYSPQVSATTL
jgi:fibronectin type 3 domain-containing protein